MFNRFECGVSEVKSQLQYKENTAPPPVKDSRCSRMARAKCIWGIINTEEAGILVFSGIPAFFVTIVLLVQRSTACNVHHAEPLFHQFHGGF